VAIVLAAVTAGGAPRGAGAAKKDAVGKKEPAGVKGPLKNKAGEVTRGVFKGVHMESLQCMGGKPVTAEEVDGKVVFVLYWGYDYVPCRQSVEQLVALHRELVPTRKFAVVTSHVQKPSDDMSKFLKKNRVVFPVYQGVNLPAVPFQNRIPDAYLVDHTGKVAESGLPSGLLAKARKLVRATPHPLVAGITLRYCKAEARALTKGKRWGRAVLALERKAKAGGPAGEEAQALLGKVEGLIAADLTRGKELLKRRPTEAVGILAELAVRAGGLPAGKEAKEAGRRMMADRHFQILRKVARVVARMQESGRKNERTLAAIKAQLTRLSKGDKVPVGVSTEATALLADL
jgi:hypothetical protein